MISSIPGSSSLSCSDSESDWQNGKKGEDIAEDGVINRVMWRLDLRSK
ncbi:MAG: hypothetical protein JWM11_4346 [Planctomycetaceae bacterium]|nr:hypothetical protein [Planctomycetaceae bacterium]